MESLGRLLLFIYNLLLIIIAGLALTAVTGRPEPMEYIQLALSTPYYRLITGIISGLVIIFGVFVLIKTLSFKSKIKSVTIEHSTAGEVCITIPAIKIIIMKAVKTIEGIKEIKPMVTSGGDGVKVCLHMMINPEMGIPELSNTVQSVVKKYLEEIGGLKVVEIKVLVDDLNPGTKTSST